MNDLINKTISINDDKTINFIETITTTDKFQPSEIRGIEIFIQNHGKPVNTYTFKKLGIKSVHACIGRLRVKGVNITTTLSDAINSAGILRKGIAHYTLKGL